MSCRHTLLALTVLLLWGLAGNAQADLLGRWTQGAPMPTARKQLANATINLNGKIYVVGGVSNGTPTDTVEVYDPQSDSWRSVAPLPLALWRTSAAALDGKLYTFGGYRATAGFPFNPTERVFAYDPEADAWSEKAPLPAARGATTAVALAGKIHVLGGASNRALSVHDVYDPANDRWESAPPLPTPRSGLTASALGGRIYVAGGYQLQGGVVGQKVLEAYNPTTQTWKRLADMPDARFGIASATLNGNLYVFGGQPTNAASRSLVYDPVQDQWRELADMPTGLTMAGVAAANGALYVIGGGPSNLGTKDGTDLNQVFHPPVTR